MQARNGVKAHRTAGGSPRGMFVVSLCVLAGGLEAATVWLTLAGSRGTSLPDRVAALAYVGIVLPVVGFGALITARRPGNRVGQLLLASGLAIGAAALVQAYVDASPSLPATRLAAWIGTWSWVAPSALVTLLLLLYPDGRLPSPRWRPVALVAAAVYPLTAVCAALSPGLAQLPGSRNPTGLDGPAGQVVQAVLSVLTWLLLALLAAAVGSLLVRFRRSRGVARQQLKWLAYGAVPAVLVWFVPLPSGLRPWHTAAANLAAWVLPAAIGVALLRYRLYEIDRLINRTLVYGTLTVVLGAGYAGGVLLLGQLLGQGRSNLAVAATTLVVAALFQPARRRIQHAVDRRFNRRRYDAATTIAAFSARLREEIDLDTLSAELLAVVDQTMEPTTASLWLRPSVERPEPFS
jgi:hypothetical protein